MCGALRADCCRRALRVSPLKIPKRFLCLNHYHHKNQKFFRSLSNTYHQKTTSFLFSDRQRFSEVLAFLADETHDELFLFDFNDEYDDEETSDEYYSLVKRCAFRI